MLYSKIVNVPILQVKANWTRKMIDDLNNFDKMYKYKFENETERIFIEKYFNNVEIMDNDAYYSSMSQRDLRKFKLLILNNNESSLLFKKIFRNSEITIIQDMFERKLSRELSNEIDIEIIKSLRDYLKK